MMGTSQLEVIKHGPCLEKSFYFGRNPTLWGCYEDERINVCRVLAPAKNLICVNVLLDFTVLLTHCLWTNEAALLFHVQAFP